MISQDPLRDLLTEDPYPLFAELRTDAPVRSGDVLVDAGLPSFTAPGDPRPRFTMFRYEDISDALRDHETYSSRFWEEPGPRKWAASLKMQGSEHRAWRKALTAVFGPKAVGVWNATIVGPIAQRCGEEVAARDSKKADLVDYALRFPLLMTYEIIGLSSDRPGQFERFQQLASDILLTVHVDPDPVQMARNVARAKAASDEIFAWLLETIGRRRADGALGSDLISHLIRSQDETGERDDEQLAHFGRSILQAATDNTTRQALNAITCLLVRPEVLEEIRSDRTLLLPALVEAERYESQSLVAPRVTTREVEVGDTTIPEGAFVLLVFASGNRDPEAFDQPDSFDIGRAGPHPLTFGLGPHVCPGMNLARSEIAAAIGALLDVLPDMRLDPDEEPPRVVGAPYRRPESVPITWS
jgi:cytochrome P450